MMQNKPSQVNEVEQVQSKPWLPPCESTHNLQNPTH